MLFANTESNVAKKLAPSQYQQFVLENIAILGAQRLHRRPKLRKHIYQIKIEKQVKKIFQIKVFKSEKQKSLVTRIKYVTVKVSYNIKCNKEDK